MGMCEGSATLEQDDRILDGNQSNHFEVKVFIKHLQAHETTEEFRVKNELRQPLISPRSFNQLTIKLSDATLYFGHNLQP